ncbi:hypothetical protein BDN72DRAFT_841827 [Pluteus cervinus]|uniref:Uncharacterized protein n=1 Tax=Pluteus cervinus TaxID=181527 RepID=A0ACD3ARU1_9AGAR|nr:hypothetical protein BDN72DRAFT_841827 [Pluteus cervinus]
MFQELQARVSTILANIATAHANGIQTTLSQEELMALGLSIGGKAGENRALERYESWQNNTWQAESLLGYCSRYHEEVHMIPIDNDFAIIYWGGPGAAANQYWSFQVSRRRGDAAVFDEDLDTPVDVAKEGICILMQVSPKKFVELLQGTFHCFEGRRVIYKRFPPTNLLK